MITLDKSPLNVCPDNIWQYKQNRPSLIVRDLNDLFGVPEHAVYKVLLARGVFKWFGVRRALIKTKDAWKVRIRTILACINDAKAAHNTYNLAYLRGYLKAYEECRAEIRALCHSDRWQVPDNDEKAMRWLMNYEDLLGAKERVEIK